MGGWIGGRIGGGGGFMQLPTQRKLREANPRIFCRRKKKDRFGKRQFGGPGRLVLAALAALAEPCGDDGGEGRTKILKEGPDPVPWILSFRILKPRSLTNWKITLVLALLSQNRSSSVSGSLIIISLNWKIMFFSCVFSARSRSSSLRTNWKSSFRHSPAKPE